MWDVEADLAYRRELWAAVPLASRYPYSYPYPYPCPYPCTYP